jgi:hypothetical protein
VPYHTTNHRRAAKPRSEAYTPRALGNDHRYWAALDAEHEVRQTFSPRARWVD